VAVRDSATGLHWLHQDHLGSTALQTSVAGAHEGTQLRGPFGQPWLASGSLATDLQYTGQRSFEAALGSLQHFGARWYSPALGRFLAPDSVVARPGDPRDLDRYGYVRSNPLRYVDPDGHTPKDVIRSLWRGLEPGATLQQYASEFFHALLRQPNAPWRPLPLPVDAADESDDAREIRARNSLVAEGYLVAGASDTDTKKLLGVAKSGERVADILAAHLVTGKYVIAESKGGDIDTGIDQLSQTLERLETNVRRAKGNTELRMYMKEEQFNKIIDKDKGIGEYGAVKNEEGAYYLAKYVMVDGEYVPYHKEINGLPVRLINEREIR
jgi:RHS repeat-associated protein